MTTTVIVPKINRPITDDLFKDLTDSPWSYTRNEVGEYVITFANDLLPSQPPFIAERCRRKPVEELLVGRLHALRSNGKIKPKKTNGGPPPKPDISDLADAVDALTKLVLGDVDVDD